MSDDNNLFNEVIHSYTRKQAIEDGFLIDVTKTAREAGIKYPVAITTKLYQGCINPSDKEKERGQDLEGRLWDTLYMFTLAARKHIGDTMHYKVIYLLEQEDGTAKQETQTIKAVIGPGDTSEPVITIMMPYED